MIVIIDNYDSFTYNIVQTIGGLGTEVKVFRNDMVDISSIEILKPERLLISPGPCTPSKAGISIEAIRYFAGKIPILGVCLGHQSLGEAFGGRTVGARRLMHGKTGEVRHEGDPLFRGIPSPFVVTRYHSLVTDSGALPPTLEPIAWSTDAVEEGEIQAMRHRELPVWGVQFHPESLFSEHGVTLLQNFLDMKPD
jgi:anthranilate synthase/aminodeoxychorismate synthase-like glutamine amidotransferase